LRIADCGLQEDEIDHRFGHQRKTLELIDPYFSVLHFSVGKTATEKCRTEKYGSMIKTE